MYDKLVYKLNLNKHTFLPSTLDAIIFYNKNVFKTKLKPKNVQ